MTFRLRHLLAALILHAALFGLLVTGAQCSRQPDRPTVINAVLLDPSRQQVTQQKQQQKAEQQRRQEQARKDAQEKQRQQDLQRQKAAEEQKRQQAEAQKKKLADAAQLKKSQELKRQKELADQKKAEEQARKKKEQQETHERQEQAQREIQDKAHMEEEMRQETARLNAQRAHDAQAASERQQKLSEWSDALERHIQKFWNRPASATGDFKCQVRVQLLPDGTVTAAKIATSCGSDPLDRSVEDAAFRASPLPKPDDPAVFDRDLIINFEP